jgi:drug efflux transport system ATP-binding protein
MTGAGARDAGAGRPAAENLIQVESLVRRFGTLTAVDGVSFEVRRGEMFGLIGPDGAGKTTTIRVILGLLKPDGGRVRLCGLDPIAEARAASHRIGYLAQRFSLYGDLSVDENIAFFAAVYGVSGWRARRDHLLDMLRMTPFRARLAERLSGGMKQKLALACTLVHTPEMLVLDEPTTGVDPVSRRDFWKILTRLQAEGLSILMTTPYLEEAERCHRVGLMARGKMLAIDTPLGLRTGSGGAIVELLATPRRRAAELVAARPGVSDVQTFGERLHATLAGVTVAQAAGVARELQAALEADGVIVQAARATEPSLEDIFIARLRALDAPGGGGAAGSGAAGRGAMGGGATGAATGADSGVAS